MASNSVDFPVPFSPTKNVTGAGNVKYSRETKGNENGNTHSTGSRSGSVRMEDK
jgi:hypothetical protein